MNTRNARLTVLLVSVSLLTSPAPRPSLPPVALVSAAVPGTQPLVPITFDYADESDPGPYPIPRLC